MNITIQKTKTFSVDFEIETPFYFKNQFNDEVYMMVDEERTVRAESSKFFSKIEMGFTSVYFNEHSVQIEKSEFLEIYDRATETILEAVGR